MPETKTKFSRGIPSSGRKLLHRGEDGVVPAAGAPAHLLVGLEVLGGQGAVPVRDAFAGHLRDHLRRVRPTSSSARNGSPRTCV